MTTQYLEAEDFYMNPETGSVGIGKEWEESFEDDEKILQCDWEEWGGETLIKVEKVNGEWVEV